MKSSLFIFLIFAAIVENQANKLSVDAFVESQCPGCIEFLTTQVKKAIQTPGIDRIVDINIYPYGNARQSKNSDGTWKFVCQHGTVECYGNLMEVCAMDLIQDNLDKLEYVVCIEDSHLTTSINGFDLANEQCAPRFGLQVQSIQQCMKSEYGNKIQHQVADATDALNPPHKYVPWIVANKSYDQNQENEIEFDLVSWACKNYTGPEVIEACIQIQM